MKQQIEIRLRFSDFEPKLGSFRDEVLHGLQKPHKELYSKYFYDERGSQLFDQICEADEYYSTRTEISILRQHIDEMAALMGEHCLLIEYGSGNSKKTRILLDALHEPAAYVPIEISKEYLLGSATVLAIVYPDLEVLPVLADYTSDFEIPIPAKPVSRRVAFFPGSTIGNFNPEPAKLFLKQVAKVVGKGGGLLIGVDVKKDFNIMHHAYNDQQGVTALFNLNMLVRINQELDADFQLNQFGHYAFYNPTAGRIEMHLVSLKNQTVSIGDVKVPFKLGESIWTESSYKYNLEEFAELAATAGFTVEHVWTDPQKLFSVQYLTVD